MNTLLFLSGFSALILELAWFRYFGIIFGSTVIAFALMLAVFLAGLALGSLLAFKLKSIAICFLGMSLTSLASLFLWDYIPIYYGNIIWNIFQQSNYLSVVLAQICVAFSILLLPTIFSGAILPLAISQTKDPGRSYGINTLGAIVGSTLAGFWIIPQLGYENAVLFVALVSGCVGLGLLPLLQWQKGMLLVLILVVVILAPKANQLILNRSYFSTIRTKHLWDKVRTMSVDRRKILFHKEGKNSTITVIANEISPGSLGFRVSGKAEAATDLVARRHLVILGHLPIWFSRNPSDVAIIGYGAGVTAGSTLSYRQVKTMDIIELEPAVIEASKYFDITNHAPLKDSRTRLIYQDGRMQLKNNIKTYDIINVDPVSPWIAGSSNLYSLEFYETVRQRLNINGVFGQWVQMADFTEDTYKSMLATIKKVFPYMAVFICGVDSIVVAAAEPLKIDWQQFLARTNQFYVNRDLRLNGFKEASELFSLFMTNNSNLDPYLADTKDLNTDDNVNLEYKLPLQYHDNQHIDFSEALIKKFSQNKYENLAKMFMNAPLNQRIALTEPLSELQQESKARRLWTMAKSEINRKSLNAARSLLGDAVQYRLATHYPEIAMEYAKLLVSMKSYKQAQMVLDELFFTNPAIDEAYDLQIESLKNLSASQADIDFFEQTKVLYFSH